MWATEDPGAFGDSFGAVNALFSGLAFAGVIVTLRQQQEQLNALQSQCEDERFLALLESYVRMLNRTVTVEPENGSKISREVHIEFLRAFQKEMGGWPADIRSGSSPAYRARRLLGLTIEYRARLPLSLQLRFLHIKSDLSALVQLLAYINHDPKRFDYYRALILQYLPSETMACFFYFGHHRDIQRSGVWRMAIQRCYFEYLTEVHLVAPGDVVLVTERGATDE